MRPSPTSRMRRPFLLLFLALAPFSLPGAAEAAGPSDLTKLPGAAAPAASFTPAQRAEIVGIVRDALRTDPSILRDALSALQADDGAKRDAAARDAIANSRQALLAAAGDPVGGNPAGDVTLVEFYDTRCPYCRKLLPTMAALLARDHGVRVVYKDLPILGPSSVVEARALLAADRQGGYLRLQDVLMRDSGDASTASVRVAAESAGLDGARLVRDMQDPAIDQRLAANITLARTLGIEGTPTMVIGNAMIPGAIEMADLQRAIGSARQGG